MAQTPEKIKEAISGVMLLLKSDNLPEAVSKIVFPKSGKPLSAWSISNKLICAINYIQTSYPEYKKCKNGQEQSHFIIKHLDEALDKADYRGFRQWGEIKRYIKKGEHAATYILAPMFIKVTNRYYEKDEKKHYLGKDENPPKGYTSKTEMRNIIAGFRGVPVFNENQTYGAKIVNKKLKLPELPFKPVADHLGIKVIPKEFDGMGYGSYSPVAKVITVSTPDQTTFFHELSHAVDDYIMKNSGKSGLRGGQHSDQEIVAQFSAMTLAYMVGYKIDESAAYTKKYVEHYAETSKPEQELIKLLSRIEKIIDFITNFKQAESPTRQAEKQEGEPAGDAEKLANNPPKADKKPDMPKKRKSKFVKGSEEAKAHMAALRAKKKK